MQCGDLDRYLEAYLDGRLGRSRGAILRRHLALCGACRARVERLRQFEREMQRRFQPLGNGQSVWQGLELDLVANGRGGGRESLLALPRPLSASLPRTATVSQRGEPSLHPLRSGQARTSGRVSRLAGVLLVTLALGAVYQMVRAYIQPSADGDETLRAYAELTEAGRPLALHSGDPARLQAWLSTELDTHVPAPPVPPGFHLLGADRTILADEEAGVVVYTPTTAPDEQPVLLFVQPLAHAEDAPLQLTLPAEMRSEVLVDGAQTGGAQTGDAQPLQELSWEADNFRFTLVGHQPQERLRSFSE